MIELSNEKKGVLLNAIDAAENVRNWVEDYPDDSKQCTTSEPCKTGYC